MTLVRMVLITCAAMPPVQLLAGVSPTTQPSPTTATAPATISPGGSMFVVTAAQAKRERVLFVLDQSGGEADKDTAFQRVLQQIARENSGIYKYVKESDLNK
jgi:hypothetical protein